MNATLPDSITNCLIDDGWLDVEYMVACAQEADSSVTLESVRQILAKLSDSLANAIIAERGERFC
ncbi:MAG: hypothetical protein ACKVZH_06330 [Blastocatellia bacterium]